MSDPTQAEEEAQMDALLEAQIEKHLEKKRLACPCECNSGGWCGGCGHAGCGGR